MKRSSGIRVIGSQHGMVVRVDAGHNLKSGYLGKTIIFAEIKDIISFGIKLARGDSPSPRDSLISICRSSNDRIVYRMVYWLVRILIPSFSESWSWKMFRCGRCKNPYPFLNWQVPKLKGPPRVATNKWKEYMQSERKCRSFPSFHFTNDYS